MSTKDDLASIVGESNVSDAWEVLEIAELLKTTTKFMDYVGYSQEKKQPIGFVKPDVICKRTLEKKTWQIVLIIKPDIEHLLEGLRDLQAIKSKLGSGWDYGVVLPPVSEYDMIEFLVGEEDWFYEIKKNGFMIWLVNPERETVVSLIGGPRDPKFKDYFASFPGCMSFDTNIAQRTSSRLLDEDM